MSPRRRPRGADPIDAQGCQSRLSRRDVPPLLMFDHTLMPAQVTNFLAREKIPDARLSIFLRCCDERAIRLGKVQRRYWSGATFEGLSC